MEEREQNKLCHLFMGDLEMESERASETETAGKRYQAKLCSAIIGLISYLFLFRIIRSSTSLSDAVCGLLLWSVCRPSIAE